MSALPRAARWYLVTLWLGAAVVLLWSAGGLAPELAFVLLGWLPIYVLLDYYEFTLDLGHGNSVSMTLADAPSVFLAAVFGLPGAIGIVVGTVIVELLRRKPWYKMLFNAAERCIIYAVVCAIYAAFASLGPGGSGGPAMLVAFVSMSAAYYVVNTLLVATVLALSLAQPLLLVYRDSFSKMHWVHFATMPFGALAALTWETNRWMLPLCVLPLLLLRRWFQAVSDLQTESQRSAALAREQAALAAERERLLGELRTKQDELVRSSKLAALGTFAAGIGHEFNNLLAGMLGFAQLGLASGDMREKDEALEVAVRLAMRGRSITGGLLTFARRRDSQHVPYLLDLVVEETLALVERELAKENIAVVRTMTPVPETMCDPGQIQQLVLNLVNNARDAMRPQGGGTLAIALAEHDKTIVLAVSDTGHGIPADLIDHIFQPFVTTKGALNGSATPGTGLGLAISHGIVEGHGGTMEVRSPPGSGATMIVRLPVVPTARAEPLPSPQGPPLRILVVDDEPDVGRSLARLLEGHGHQVVVAQSAETALRAYEANPYDVVITDVVMPGLGGVELVYRLRALDPHAHVVAMSGQGGDLQEQQLEAAGVRTLLRKPFTLEELLREIERVSSEAVRH